MTHPPLTIMFIYTHMRITIQVLYLFTAAPDLDMQNSLMHSQI